MKKFGCLAALWVIAVWAALMGVSWLITCGIVKLVTMCFGWTFTWGMATGVWLIMILAKAVFSNHTTVKTK